MENGGSITLSSNTPHNCLPSHAWHNHRPPRLRSTQAPAPAFRSISLEKRHTGTTALLLRPIADSSACEAVTPCTLALPPAAHSSPPSPLHLLQLQLCAPPPEHAPTPAAPPTSILPPCDLPCSAPMAQGKAVKCDFKSNCLCCRVQRKPRKTLQSTACDLRGLCVRSWAEPLVNYSV